MNKRLILAIGLAFLIMLAWSKLTQKFYPIDTQEVTKKIPPSPVSAPVVSTPKKEEVLKTAVSYGRELVFSLPSACLKQVNFSEYDQKFELQQGLCLSGNDLAFTLERLDSKQAIFVHQDARMRITKHFDYSDPNFIITLDIKVENRSNQPMPYPSSMILGTINLNSRGFDSRFTEAFVGQPDGITRLNPKKESKMQYNGDFFGFRDRYFCAIIIPVSFPEGLQIIRANHANSQLILSRPTTELLPNQTGDLKYKIYLGPQQAGLLKSFDSRASQIINYGFFDPISKLLLNILRFFSRIVHNWGLAIIMLSLFIFFVLFPLSLKQMRSVKEMQHLQPKIEELRRTYKDNAQRMNKEVMELYRKNKINPLGGCLPMILQIPIFFALYQALMRTIELKGANFLWIKDLSQPDRLITSPEINILPVLMAITMFVQQRFTMMPAVGSSGEQQRLMSFLFPVLFGFIFYRMPSGLVLYWFINSLLMSAYQIKIRMADEPIKH